MNGWIKSLPFVGKQALTGQQSPSSRLGRLGHEFSLFSTFSFINMHISKDLMFKNDSSIGLKIPQESHLQNFRGSKVTTALLDISREADCLAFGAAR